jgi:membrane protease YdiL (CAAX protease family)
VGQGGRADPGEGTATRLDPRVALGLALAAGSVGWVTNRIAIHSGWNFPSAGYLTGELLWNAWILFVLWWGVRRYDGRRIDAEIAGLRPATGERAPYPYVAALVVGAVALALSQLVGADPTSGATYGPVHEAGFALAVGELLVRYPTTVLVEEAMFRGWMQPRLGVYGPVLSAVVWAGFHLQQVETIPQIVLFGLALGWIRWWTGSVRVTGAVHYVSNAAFFVSNYL